MIKFCIYLRANMNEFSTPLEVSSSELLQRSMSSAISHLFNLFADIPHITVSDLIAFCFDPLWCFSCDHDRVVYETVNLFYERRGIGYNWCRAGIGTDSRQRKGDV